MKKAGPDQTPASRLVEYALSCSQGKAQSAGMYTVGDASKTDAGGTVADKITAPPDVRRSRQRLRQAVAGVSPSSTSTKDRARTSASALNKRYSLKNFADPY
jgi:hypothetical protein